MKAILLLCLVASSIAFQMTKKSLPSLQSASFGNLFAEIRAQIKSGGALGNIEGLLDQLEEQINQEQREHDEMLARNALSCSEEAAFRNNEINEGSAALRRAGNQLAACQQSKDKGEVDHTQTEQDIQDSTAALETATQRREEAHHLHLKDLDDHRGAISVIKGALGILDELVSEEATLVQLSAHTSMLLRTGVKINLAHHYAPVIALFAQMATSEFDMFLDSGSVERIRSLLEELMGKVEEEMEEETLNEAAAQENYNILKNQLENSIRDLENNKVALEDHLEEMAQCVLEEKLLVTKAEEKISRNSALLRLSEEMCEAFVDEHTAATDSRNEEKELLKTVRKMVRRRLEGPGGGVSLAEVGSTERKTAFRMKW